MFRRNLTIIIIALVVIVILTAVWWFFVRPSSFPIFNRSDTTGSGTLPQSANLEGGKQVPEPSIGGVAISDPTFGDVILKRDLENKSRTMVERIASYSSDSNLTNMADLYPEMSEELKTNIEEKRASLLQKFAVGEEYVGYTVTVITTDVRVFNREEGEARVKLSAQRSVTRGKNAEQSVEYLDYEVFWKQQQDGSWRANALSGTF